MLLYETTMQIVPLLLITLFLDTRNEGEKGDSKWSRRWIHWQDRAFALLGLLAFITSLLIVAESAAATRVTSAVVISTLSMAIGLLFTRIWQRLDQRV
ncbi:hypothetical protein O4160_18530 [Rhodococcus sp. IEGM 1401]|uniref:hypothetical protein n=1 Tax=unclassified Rhodococcus (in: high G+C Gram-positive bacteria) TaxID=192944 RepID=UPI0007BC0387|nr:MULTISPECIES: hypothetical protein [unclassified Rhodococcus (in: high G+C Gram-positive bacteria)]KZF03052.1 hypothetical protein A2J04_06650 [Rhodococcus sp. EPR-279]KZF09680.1 hypothetical protein A2J02_17915 [Rhodococcus sp. EPR-147]MCZ4562842.1 hypothetical protein [Rhodococcus sp. IEGM 1401]MDI9922965.1 hypothetical protein [Rhodococcus sp. IEGM 1372]MDV8035563.1 hypothetical protein [Rhodococcus sp. IEGM 1414]